MQRIFIIAGAAALVACAAKSSTAPATGTVAGSWSGSISDARAGNGALTLSLAQAGDSVTGTWAAAYADTVDDIGGTVFGHVAGSTVTILLKPGNPPTCQYGPFEVTAALVPGASLNGTYSTVQCTLGDSGTVAVAIQ
jgi:hypothetical protein